KVVRPQPEYGLAVIKSEKSVINHLEKLKTLNLKKTVMVRLTPSVVIMRHLLKLLSMQKRPYILQADFMLQHPTLPDNALLKRLLPQIFPS
ncbi:hypothetical protein BDF20DRAFT_820317, partial [Mycotypha africana]|uniref:uncharacterized protein n=1 Tax=Mycotypha africana TaxID=64632 RepID=UPI002301E43A